MKNVVSVKIHSDDLFPQNSVAYFRDVILKRKLLSLSYSWKINYEQDENRYSAWKT